ncbi:MAG: hypothetical protein KJZ78_24950 [Bryobacteraceae bacterium]|nr:hypothetical protein [Bryobacteraceae bacterium]
MNKSQQTIKLVPDEANGAPLTEHLRNQIQQIVDEIGASEPVQLAYAAWEKARNRMSALLEAQSRIGAEYARLSAECNRASLDIRSAIIEHYAAGAQSEFLDSYKKAESGADPLRALDIVTTLRPRVAALGDALERIVEHEHARADIQEKRAHADYLDAVASGLKRQASERIQWVISSLGEIVAEEGSFTFDPSDTISGALMRLADSTAGEAFSFRQAAEERNRAYTDFCKQNGIY